MRCEHCGKPLQKGEKFCPECGLPVDFREDWGQDWVLEEERPEESVRNGKNSRKTAAAVLTAAALALILLLQNFSLLPLLFGGGPQDVGSGSPEEAAEAFAREIASNDLEGALDLFGTEHILANFDFASYLERTGSWYPGQEASYPPSETIFGDAKREIRRGQAAQQILLLCYSLKADEEYKDLREIEGDTERFAEQLEEVCNLDHLDTFRILRMDPYTPLEYWGDRGEQDPYEELAAMSGADDWEEYLILYEYDGQTYQGGMTFLCYEEQWYVQYLYRGRVSPLLRKMSESEYLATPGLK